MHTKRPVRQPTPILGRGRTHAERTDARRRLEASAAELGADDFLASLLGAN